MASLKRHVVDMGDDNLKADMLKYERFTNDDLNDEDIVPELDLPDKELDLGALEFEPTIDVGTIYKTETQTKSEDLEKNGRKDSIDLIDDGAESVAAPSTIIEFVKHYLKRVIEHLAFRLFGLLIIILDLCIVIADLIIASDIPAFNIIAIIIVTFFMVEVLCRIFVKGPKKFFTIWYEVLDFCIIFISFIITIVYTSILLEYDNNQKLGFAKLIVAGRLIRIFRIVQLVTEKKRLTKSSRLLVSQNKRRYRKDGFDLDLTYVTDRVIAMSFPSSGGMSLYRNPIKEVVRFFDTKHYAHYKVYNLCSERTYDPSKFHGMVERFYIEDHNVPTLREMLKFSSSVKEWIDANPKNVIAVHCKGGKGRTGTMICIWLVECGKFEEAKESLDYFGNRRTDLAVSSKFQGVETPSQSRFVGYYEIMKNKLNGELPPSIAFKLINIRIFSLSTVGAGDGSDLTFEIYMEKKLEFYCKFGIDEHCQSSYDTNVDVLTAIPLNCPPLVNEVKVMFHCSSKKVPKGYDKCPFYFWFHTYFISDNKLHLSREELDNPHKPKTWKVFGENFAVELEFADATSLNHTQEIPLK